MEAHGMGEFFEMSLDLLCVTGLDGYFKQLSPSWETTLGWTLAELMSSPTIDLVHPDDRSFTLEARARLSVGVPLRALTNRYRCKDGSYRWFEWRSVADVDRQIVYAVARDITEQREAHRVVAALTDDLTALQKQLVFVDRMAAIGTLAAGAAHEINNPLANVVANLDMLMEEMGSTNVGWKQMAGDARHAAERIRKIVRGLGTFSRVQDEQRAVLDVRLVLDLAVTMAFNEIRHRARLVKDYGETPFVEADQARLAHVFINLLVNAAQALANDIDTNEIRIVTSTDESGRAVIEIRDNGPGIPAEVMARVFDPFFTTKAIGVGTGLGLSICHNVVTSLGGQITASNQRPSGANFRVVLPPASTVPSAPTLPLLDVTIEASPVKLATILIIDDEHSVAVALGRALREHDVTIVTSAKEALALIALKRFDVVLSDLMMPEMSGMDFHAELVRRGSDVAGRMMFISGGAFTEAAHTFLERVGNVRIAKPFSPVEVRALVKKALH